MDQKCGGGRENLPEIRPVKGTDESDLIMIGNRLYCCSSSSSSYSSSFASPSPPEPSYNTDSSSAPILLMRCPVVISFVSLVHLLTKRRQVDQATTTTLKRMMMMMCEEVHRMQFVKRIWGILWSGPRSLLCCSSSSSKDRLFSFIVPCCPAFNRNITRMTIKCWNLYHIFLG